MNTINAFPISDEATEKLDSIKDQLPSRFQNRISRFKSAMSSTGSHLQDQMGTAGETVKKSLNSTTSYVKANPWKSAAVATVLGGALAYWMRSRR